MTTSTSRTFYDVLGLNKNASRPDIKDAYKKMALRFHPDKNPGNNAAVTSFQEIGEAYETLYDNTKRMHYNVKIGVNGQRPPFPQMPYGYAQDPNTFQGHPSPVFNSFWSKASQWHQPRRPPEWNLPKEDWSKPYVPPTEDCWEQWDKEEQEKKAREERKAAKREKRKEQLVTEIPQRLAVIHSIILQLGSAIEKLEADQRTAEDAVDLETYNEQDESLFWEWVFDNNIKLNTLRRERESSMNDYKRLYRNLKKLDPKRSEEARETYEGLRKKFSNEKDSSQSDLYDLGNQAAMRKEQHRQQEDRMDQYTRLDDYEEERPSEDAIPEERPASFSEQLPSTSYQDDSSADDRGSPDTQAGCNEAQAGDTSEKAGKDSDKDADDEVILYQTRMIHATHREVQAEFWSIADENDLCCYCGNTCVVMQCPRFEECGLCACEHCKNSR